ncbi:hypothetical protein TrVE_jg4023 [Triparma verrucosa]|uniref:Uncharacterized protein n=1 Tax=Triparma verrucosa TaxID=1606542 RepID=A0A9W7DMA2_9STRA|nr:hypothetical protein TrVE_jg4023 [Triparma verrucosa]
MSSSSPSSILRSRRKSRSPSPTPPPKKSNGNEETSYFYIPTIDVPTIVHYLEAFTEGLWSYIFRFTNFKAKGKRKSRRSSPFKPSKSWSAGDNSDSDDSSVDFNGELRRNRSSASDYSFCDASSAGATF